MDRYERQEPLSVDRHQWVAIVGCGGIGSWVALMLALAGVEKLHLFDSDKVSLNNLNRLPFSPSDIGKPKVVALSELLVTLNLDIEVIGHANLEAGHNDCNLDGCNWVICTTDSHKSRLATFELARDYGAGYIECGADGNRASVSFSPGEFTSELEEQPGYHSVPVFVGPCAMAASVVSYYVLLGPPMQDTTISIDWMNGRLVIKSISDDDEEPAELVEEPAGAEEPVLVADDEDQDEAFEFNTEDLE